MYIELDTRDLLSLLSLVLFLLFTFSFFVTMQKRKMKSIASTLPAPYVKKANQKQKKKACVSVHTLKPAETLFSLSSTVCCLCEFLDWLLRIVVLNLFFIKIAFLFFSCFYPTDSLFLFSLRPFVRLPTMVDIEFCSSWAAQTPATSKSSMMSLERHAAQSLTL